MQALSYFIALPFIHLIARLPFRLLYALSDLLRFVLFGLIGYRTEVVDTNLRNAFPDKSDAERIQIRLDFQRWFCDLTLETLKTLAISPRELQQRVSFEGTDMLRGFKEKGQSIILVLGHLGNWELAGARYSRDKDMPQLYVIYHPLQNRWFDGLMYRIRTRHGTKLYPMQKAAKSMMRDRGLTTATAFIADQTPAPERAYWTTFMNQDTPVFFGTEALARKLNYPVVYISAKRPKRGHYVMSAELLVQDPKSMKQGAITEKHTKRLEEDIRNSPDIWLWTHRRWKHKRPQIND